MATEQNEQVQDLGQEQVDQQTTQAETEQTAVSVEDLQAQIKNLEES